MKCVRVSFEAGSDSSKPINLMFKVIGTAVAVARVAELTVGKTVAVTVCTHRQTVAVTARTHRQTVAVTVRTHTQTVAVTVHTQTSTFTQVIQ